MPSSLIRYLPGSAPLVLDSPHSGVDYPKDFRSALSLDVLRGFGYDVAYNHPYKGVELVRRYGDPQAQRHSIQVEINRKLYMDEHTLEPHQGFDTLRAQLRQLVEQLLSTDPRKLG